ncbi:MAG: hypothetical protein HRT89_06415 [Lentisphaeria bacterium]|nr:hypothetical protein [Lentisphaeria bacterium]
MENESDIDKTFAISAFNDCWKLIDKSEQSDLEKEEMVRLAEVSYWHWNRVEDKTDQNLSIGLWQLARVYTIAYRFNQAKNYANQCIEISERAGLNPFYLGYGYESLARAQKGAGEDFVKALEQATQHCNDVNDDESRKMLKKDLQEL